MFCLRNKKNNFQLHTLIWRPGDYESLSHQLNHASVSQSVTCMATDGSLTSDPGVANSIPAWSHTSVEIGHEIISTVILLPSAESFNVISENMCRKYWLIACSSLHRKKCC